MLTASGALAQVAHAAPRESTPATRTATALHAPRRQAPRRHLAPTSEQRLRRLVQMLKLDAAQQAEVRRALQAHRDAIRRVTSSRTDAELPRVAAIRAITDHTTARIRAILNDEQKKLYREPLPHEPAGEPRPRVDEWLDRLQPREK
jgi:hypothetical protein